MSLSYCTKCGHLISTTAPRCPGCGVPPYRGGRVASPVVPDRRDYGSVPVINEERQMFIQRQTTGMQRAGGIVALVAGIFGIFAAIVTLLIGGMGTAFNAQGAATVVGLGWGGVAFSFATIILGAVTIGAKSKVPGIFIIICAIVGAILGGTFVAIFMVLALAGGIIATVGTKTSVPPSAVAFDYNR
jgi:hypothetical protein